MNWLPLLPFALFFVFLFLVRSRKSCPDCGSPLPSFQSPRTKTKRQWLEGGFLCVHCGCESDVSGVKVLAGTPPRFQSTFNRIALVALALVVGAVLLLVLIRP